MQAMRNRNDIQPIRVNRKASVNKALPKPPQETVFVKPKAQEPSSSYTNPLLQESTQLTVPKIRVAAYIRVSTHSDNQSTSYDTQRSYFTQLIQSHSDWILAGIYCDYGRSGTNSYRRTGFLRLLNDAKAGKLDRILCKSISRFARNTVEFLEAITSLQELHIPVLFEKEGIDTEKEECRFVLTVFASLAQSESESISANQKMAYQNRCKNGQATNREIYGYRKSNRITKDGYTYWEVRIEESEAKVVRRIFEEVHKGRSYSSIARDLNQEGIPSPSARFQEKDEGWKANRIAQIIRLERYTGDVLLQKRYVENPLSHKNCVNHGELPRYQIFEHHPAIIDRSLFEAVQPQAMHVKTDTKTTKRPSPLTGLLVCKTCQQPYVLYSSYKGKRIWCCRTKRIHTKTNCKNINLAETTILGILQATIRQRFVTKKDAVSFLESVQNTESYQRQSATYKTLLEANDQVLFQINQRLNSLQEEIHLLTKRRNQVPNTEVTNVLLKQIQLQYQQEQTSKDAIQKEREQIRQALKRTEDTCRKLECFYEARSKVIETMKSNRFSEDTWFLLSLEEAVVFFLNIEIQTKLPWTITWADETVTTYT